jgi:hypothetical protein
MANTITRAGNLLNIVVVDANWLWTDSFAEDWAKGGIPLDFIIFVPGLANDKAVIKSGSSSGPVMFNALCLDLGEKIVYYHGAIEQPSLTFTDGVYHSGNILIMQLWPGLFSKRF